MAQTTDTARLTRPIRTVTVLAPTERAAITRRMRAHTIIRAAAILGVARHAMERAAGGLTIQRGTAALIRIALARLAAEEQQP